MTDDIMNDDIMTDTIDDTWINEFKKKESNYNDFYKEETISIKIFFLYVNGDKVLEYVKSDNLILEKDGMATKEQLISLIKSNQTNNSIRYKLLSLMKFNIDIEPMDITNFLYESEDHNEFITSERYLDDIKFMDTICILQDLNSLFFLFHEFPKKKQETTTRKIIMHSTARKTKRKKT